MLDPFAYKTTECHRFTPVETATSKQEASHHRVARLSTILKFWQHPPRAFVSTVQYSVTNAKPNIRHCRLVNTRSIACRMGTSPKDAAQWCWITGRKSSLVSIASINRFEIVRHQKPQPATIDLTTTSADTITLRQYQVVLHRR